MSSWRVARSLEVLLGEINAAAPHRSKISDGSIGDPRHQAGWTSSDHNPFIIFRGQGIVRARDFTHDPGDLDCNDLADALAALIAVGGHPACRSGAYVIWQRRIFSFDRRNEGWRSYSGSNPHEKHLHLSVATDAAGFDSTAMWGVMIQKDWFDMATKEDLKSVVDASVRRLERKLDGLRTRERERHQRILGRLDTIEAESEDDATKVQIRRLRADLADDTP